MIKKIGAVLAGVVLAVLGFAVPAQAAALHGCPDNATCLYQSTNYSYGRLTLTFQGIYNSTTSHCYNMGNVHFNNGTPDAQANNNTASLVTNTTGDGVWSHWNVLYYDLPNCQLGGADYFAEGAGLSDDFVISDLRNMPMNLGTNAWHRLSSVQMTYNPPPS